MKAPVRQFLSAVALVAGLSTAGMSHAASVTIAPGSSPGGGYLPLSAFGIAALRFVGGYLRCRLVTSPTRR